MSLDSGLIDWAKEGKKQAKTMQDNRNTTYSINHTTYILYTTYVYTINEVNKDVRQTV
jgi:hypothetical protein